MPLSMHRLQSAMSNLKVMKTSAWAKKVQGKCAEGGWDGYLGTWGPTSSYSE